MRSVVRSGQVVRTMVDRSKKNGDSDTTGSSRPAGQILWLIKHSQTWVLEKLFINFILNLNELNGRLQRRDGIDFVGPHWWPLCGNGSNEPAIISWRCEIDRTFYNDRERARARGLNQRTVATGRYDRVADSW